jgi:hypothetical protein
MTLPPAVNNGPLLEGFAHIKGPAIAKRMGEGDRFTMFSWLCLDYRYAPGSRNAVQRNGLALLNSFSSLPGTFSRRCTGPTTRGASGKWYEKLSALLNSEENSHNLSNSIGVA